MSRSLTGSEIAQPAYQSVVNEGALEVNNMLAFLNRAGRNVLWSWICMMCVSLR